jgi:hypothetical protein
MPTNNNTILVVIQKPIVLPQHFLLALAVTRYAITSTTNLDRRHMPILIVRDGAELEFVVKWLVAMRTATVVAESVRCPSRVRLLGAARAEMKEALEERAESCNVTDEHAEGGFSVAPDEDVGEAVSWQC